jgi:hypothetical protein
VVKIDINFWNAHPYDEAVAVVSKVFGASSVNPMCRTHATHNVVGVYVPDTEGMQDREDAARRELDRLGWQFIMIEDIGNRFRSARPDRAPLSFSGLNGLNTYGLSPLLPLVDRPKTVFHATPSKIALRCLVEGIRPSRGQNGYSDTRGKLHVCRKLESDAADNAVWWAKALSERDCLPLSTYSILEVSIVNLPPIARVYADLNSVSGVVIDRFDKIPPSEILQEFRLRDTPIVLDEK